MPNERATRITDKVVAELVDCTPKEVSVEEVAFRAGYRAALNLGYLGEASSEDITQRLRDAEDASWNEFLKK